MPPLLIEARSRLKTRVAGVIETGGRVLEHTAVDALNKPVVAEIVDRARPVPGIRNHWWEERLPTNTIIHGQSWLDLPGVGRIKVDAGVARIVLVGRALRDSRDSSYIEIAL